MSYFSYLPVIDYTFDGNTNTVSNTMVRLSFIDEMKNYIELYTKHEWTDSDNIASVSEKYYGTHKYYWVILLLNEIHDIKFDLPLTSIELDLYIESVYGADRTKIRHWVDIDTDFIVGEFNEYNGSDYQEPANPGEPGNLKYAPITFEDYENIENEKKRYIKILRPEFITEFISQYKKLLT